MRRRSWAFGARLALAVVVLGACGSSSSNGLTSNDASVPPWIAPSAGDLAAFSYLTDTIPATITVDGARGLAVIDTGDPWVLLDPTTFPAAASLSQSGGTVPSIALAGTSTNDPWVYGSTTGDVDIDPTFAIEANVGCTVLCGLVASFNYRDVTLTLGSATTPSGLEASTTLGFMLLGGDGTSMFPASRIVVTVSLEGKDYSMILDTGATDVTVSAAAFAALTADGRTQISGGVDTTSGMSTSSLTRAATVAVGGVVVDGVVIAHDPSFDTNQLSQLSSDVGYTIDGSLGGTFLHDFYVTVDYAKEQLTLARYQDLSFILDQGELIGITLGVVSGTGVYEVTAVSGDAATKKVSVNDVVTAIDGTDLASVSSLQVAALIYGKVGSTKQVTFGKAAKLANMTVPILVDETLPLPSAG